MNRQDILGDLSEYWEEVRGNRLPPRRSDLNPNRFGAALEHMFILETVEDGPLRIRLAGSRLCDMMGMEARGMPARAMFAIPDQMRADDLFSEVVRHPACIDMDLTGLSGEAAQYQGSMMLRPLFDDLGAITRVLGCLVIDAPRYETDIAITIDTVLIHTLRQKPKSAAPAGFAEAQAAFAGPHLRSVSGSARAPRQPLSRSHLRVVSSND